MTCGVIQTSRTGWDSRTFVDGATELPLQHHLPSKSSQFGLTRPTRYGIWGSERARNGAAASQTASRRFESPHL